eukprot:6554100-Ditylum_brightwellii.AAC.1
MPVFSPALKAVGFFPFNVLFLTDHGSLFANFEEDTLFLGALDNPLDQIKGNWLQTIQLVGTNTLRF